MSKTRAWIGKSPTVLATARDKTHDETCKLLCLWQVKFSGCQRVQNELRSCSEGLAQPVSENIIIIILNNIHGIFTSYMEPKNILKVQYLIRRPGRLSPRS